MICFEELSGENVVQTKLAPCVAIISLLTTYYVYEYRTIFTVNIKLLNILFIFILNYNGTMVYKYQASSYNEYLLLGFFAFEILFVYYEVSRSRGFHKNCTNSSIKAVFEFVICKMP